MFEFFHDADMMILDSIHSTFSSGFMDGFMTFMSKAGVIIFLCSLCILFLAVKKWRRYGFCLISTVLLSLLICEIIIKPLVLRQRPYTELMDGTIYYVESFGTSFPSTHTCLVVSASTVAFAADRKIGAFASIIAALIAFSRLYLYAHFFTDVCTGMFLGLAIAFITLFTAGVIAKKVLKKNKSNK